MGDTESSSRRQYEYSPVISRKRLHTKSEVFNEVFRKLREVDVEEAAETRFEDELWSHFSMLPLRYALDVNTERAEDVLMHKRLLKMARDPITRPAVHVRLVQAHRAYDGTPGNSVHSGLNNSTSMMRPLHEITISTKDKPKLLSLLTLLMSKIGLEIEEAHAFCTSDGYSLVVFIVDGWEKGIDQLKNLLVREILKLERESAAKQDQ